MDSRIEYIAAMRDCGRTFVDSAIPILEEQQAEAQIDLYDPTADEIVGALTARIFRFLQTFVLDYHLWAEDLGRSVLRMMLESLFYLRFLIERNERELFREFQKYGIGQEKLFKMQLRKLLENNEIEDSEELRAFIDSDADEEISDELVNVKLKNFDDLRKVAAQADLKKEYVLQYQPDSVIVHGHWPALRRYHLAVCEELLHREHLRPHFHLPPLEPRLIENALECFQVAYLLWRGRYDLPDRLSVVISDYWKCCGAIGDDERDD